MTIGLAADRRGVMDAAAIAGTAAVLALAAILAAAPAHAQATETIAGILVHGNHTTPAGDIIALAGLERGAPADEERLREAERRLRDTGRFAAVEVRRRFASIDDPSAMLVVILVDEHAAVSEDDLTPGPLDRLTAAGMWLPIVSYADGYGFTYGARVSFPGAFGERSRLSVPMTWGGERRIAVEAERPFGDAARMLRGAVGLARRVNPHFDRSDVRAEGRVEAEQHLSSWLRAGAAARVARVSFGSESDATHTAAGAYAEADTRLDPSFPRNAVHARVGWETLWMSRERPAAFSSADRPTAARASRWWADVRGYAGLLGSTVLAVRAQAALSNARLPDAERALLGGGASLRGYHAGHRAGDNLVAATAELRVPITSPLSVARAGVKAFADAGTAWSSGERLRGRAFERGAGVGVYAGAAAFIAAIDVAWPETGKPRIHASLGVTF